IGLALHMYASDYDDMFPHNWFTLNAGGCQPGGGDWMEVSQPYVKNWQLFMCPSFQTVGATTPEGLEYRDCSVNTTYRSLGGRHGGYAANAGRPGVIGQIGNGPFGNSSHRNVKLDAVREPANTIAVLESRHWCAMFCGVGHAGADTGSTTGWDAREYRHNDGMNVLWTDGHVKWHGKTFRREEFGT
ncbi:MAG: H-X9-DG-CTERM domain-containing protein, partial [Armatimonadota bacterium]